MDYHCRYLPLNLRLSGITPNNIRQLNIANRRDVAAFGLKTYFVFREVGFFDVWDARKRSVSMSLEN